MSSGFEADWDWNDVTLVTHASIDKLHLLRKLVNHWQGLISGRFSHFQTIC